jgi:hypothetical protein
LIKSLEKCALIFRLILLKISDKPKTYHVYKTNEGTRCRDIKVELCRADGKLMTHNALMWETTYQNNFIEMSTKLPQVTMARVIENDCGDGGVIVIVYILDWTSFLVKPIAGADISFERTKEFVENYEKFYLWLKEIYSRDA